MSGVQLRLKVTPATLATALAGWEKPSLRVASRVNFTPGRTYTARLEADGRPAAVGEVEVVEIIPGPAGAPPMVTLGILSAWPQEEEPAAPSKAAVPTPGPAERRTQPRIQMEVDVRVESGHAFYTGLTQDVSKGGLFLATARPEPVGTRVSLKLTLFRQRDPVEVEAEVRWLRERSGGRDAPQGMGLRFLDLSPAARGAISEFLSTHESLFYDDE